jgi:hypothetical protein
MSDSDLLPTSRTKLKEVKSAHQENGEHEEEKLETYLVGDECSHCISL